MIFRSLLSGVCALFVITSSAVADTSRPDAHAPIGVMRDHVHKKGEVMVSYRFGYMHMAGNRNNTASASTQDVLNDYMVAPSKMPMNMHMIGAMVGVTDKLTVGAMGGVIENEMDHVRRDGSTFSTENDGFTDTQVNAMVEVYRDNTHRVQLNAGVSLPTGDDNDRLPNGAIFPYAMQTGSGTYDLEPGVSYSGASEHWSWGSQVNATVPLGRNSRGYTRGDSYNLTGWGARKVNDAVSVSLRLNGNAWEGIDGRDRELAGPMFMAPSMDANLQGGERVDALVGVNFTVPNGALEGHRLAAEFGVPVYQRIDGPRIETDYRFTLGWQKAF